MTAPPISRYPVPKLADLPEDIRMRMLEVQEKAGVHPQCLPDAGASSGGIPSLLNMMI